MSVVNPQQAACHEDKDGNYGVGDERQPQGRGHRETQYAGRLVRLVLGHGPGYKSGDGFTARYGQETVDDHGYGDDDRQDAEAFRSKYPGGEGQLGQSTQELDRRNGAHLKGLPHCAPVRGRKQPGD